MKYILQQGVIAASALFFTSFLFPGLSITGGPIQFLYATIFLVVGFLVLKPILQIIAFPLSIITLGLFSTIITIVVLFVITLVDHNFSINPFLFGGVPFLAIPSFQVNIFLSYVLISVTIQLIYRLFAFVFDL